MMGNFFRLPVPTYFGQSPIIVRSSSLLEDSFGHAFAGKYESVFCVNTGTPEDRLASFENAIRCVYASCMDESALAYRRQRGLEESDEQMAILVQRVSGSLFGHFFLPAAAGVSYSFNAWKWHESIECDKGMIRLVAGLGTRAVDRTDSDYPRLIALGRPDLPPTYATDSTRYCQ
ncbi:MAG TPA: PEP/pyruvate-binding domain-containing protein [Treponemataceae bacterium]|nr:PEP/pyruvate-binding domain-containing protein [Treponemataceae bacterium]